MGSLVLAGATSGSTTITPSATGTYTITLPAETGTIQTSGAGFTTNGVAYATSTTALATGSGLVFTGTNLGIGTSSPSTVLDVASSNSGMTLTNTAVSNKKWRVGGNSSGYFQITETGIADRLTIDTSGNVNISTSNAGIIFNNGSALTNSTLNDYETGTFSPTWSGSTSGSGVKGTGTYTKIGNLVFVTVIMQGVTFISFSGTLQMSLPFSAGGAVNAQYTGAPMYFFDGSWFNDSTTAGITPYANYGSNTATFGYMYVNGLRQTSVASNTSSLSNGNSIYARFSFMYQTF